MLRKTVPHPYSGDWKTSVAVGLESGRPAYEQQTVRDNEAQTPSKLRLSWMMKFVRTRLRRVNYNIW